MLVLFIYVTSLASNEIFNFSIKLLGLNLLIIFLSTIVLYIVDQAIFINYIKNYEISSIPFISLFLEENRIILNKLYNFPINIITIILIIYLFLTLIAIVKITNIFEGPLRPNSN
jgi:NADH-ubiquinone oxidoreductase chain 6